MYYYDSENNTFYSDETLPEGADTSGMTEYSDEAYETLMSVDRYHYVTRDEETGLPVQAEKSDDAKKRILRQRRRKLCFPYINRGGLWYDSLTEEQQAELKTWYAAWLDVTETYTEPEAPDWLE